MSSVTSPKSERSQTLTAVLFMSLFVATFVTVMLIKDNIMSYACQSKILKSICANAALPLIDSDSFITSQIRSACVDNRGLKITVAFGTPLTGETYIQVFTTGEDVFPTAQGMSDTFETSTTIPGTITELDFVIPVESMPVGEQIFGNIVTSQEKVLSSHVAYFIQVTACSIARFTNATLMTTLDAVPINHSATCLPSGQLMVAFEFDEPVQGQFQALVAGRPYQLVSVGNQPAVLFFSGEHPRNGSVDIKLISATDQTIMFEGNSTPPVCSVNE